MRDQIIIRPGLIFKILLGIIAFLFIGHCFYMFTIFVKGYSFRAFFDLFNFNAEGNFTTFYSVLAIGFAALLLFIVGILKRSHKIKDANYWLALSAIFIFLSYDEAAQVHERFNKSSRAIIPEEGYDLLYYAWVVPYAIFALIIGFAFLKFLFRLPKKTAILFTIAGVVFVTGAVGLELLNSYFFYNEGDNSFGLYLAFTIEELLEMTGVALFIYAILDYIKSYMGEIFVFGTKDRSVDVDYKTTKHIIFKENDIYQKSKIK